MSATRKNNRDTTKIKIGKKPITCHDAAVDAFRKMFAEYLKAKVIEIKDEHRLSKEALRIDILIIKKKRDVQIDTNIARIFRAYNIVEFKSPNDKPTLYDFNKVVHGYVGIYASQEKIKLTDMTVTIVCGRKPDALFETLKQEFNYKILRKSDGIYYIMLKGSVPEKSLLIQIVVYSELPDSELLLKGLMPETDVEQVRKQVRRVLEYGKKQRGYDFFRSPWGLYYIAQNPKILLEETDMNNRKKLEKALEEMGWTEKWVLQGERRGRQKGMREGISELLQFLKSGHSIEEAEKVFAFSGGGR